MPGPHPLTDASLRLDWANGDGEAFATLSKWFSANRAYDIGWRNVGGPRFEVTFHRRISADDEAERFTELARLLGSFLDHSRAALNYAAYQLALAAVGEGAVIKNVDAAQFPIFQSGTLYRKQNRFKSYPQRYRDAIEKFQPFTGGWQGLWLLETLAGEYRHHVVHPTAVVSGSDTYSVSVDLEPVPKENVEPVTKYRLHNGDVLFYFSLPESQWYDTTIIPLVGLTVGIDHPLCRDMIGTSVLNAIRSDVETVLDTLEAEFFPVE